MTRAHPGSGYIDLHSHTTASDGTYTPEELVALAKHEGLDALAITDHDTFGGFDEALPFARAIQLDLVRGIELNTRLDPENHPARRTIHLLAYFLNGEPGAEFTGWLEDEKLARRTRNKGLVESLQKNGVEISLGEVEQRGRTLAGRPHFASILMEKGYADSSEEAFNKYLGERAPSFVERRSKTCEEVIGIVRGAGGVPVVAHPIRLRMPRDEERSLLMRLKAAGLLGLEVYHSEHPPELQAYYRQLAEELEFWPTGGSDFHGAVKPDIQLGTGANGNLRIPAEFLAGLRNGAAIPAPGARS